MNVQWKNPDSLVVPKSEAETLLTKLVAENMYRLRRNIVQHQLLTQAEILACLDSMVDRVMGVAACAMKEIKTHGWVIVTTSKATKELPSRTMFMVDRTRVKWSWWSDDIEDACIFDSQQIAERRTMTLKHNEPRVVSLDEARIMNQENEEVYNATAEVLA